MGIGMGVEIGKCPVEVTGGEIGKRGEITGCCLPVPRTGLSLVYFNISLGLALISLQLSIILD